VKLSIIFSLKKYSNLFPGTGQLICPVFYIGVMLKTTEESLVLCNVDGHKQNESRTYKLTNVL